MEISPNGLRLIEQEEGFVDHPYWDPIGGVWTRGFGETEGIHSNSSNISLAYGQQNLKSRFERFYAPALERYKLDQNEYDGFADAIWNLGPGVVEAGSEMGNLLEAGNIRQAAIDLLQYDHGGGQIIPDLVRRRQREYALIISHVSNPLDVLYPHERKVVDQFDAIKHHHEHRALVKKLVAEMTTMRKIVWLAAEKGELPGGHHTAKGWNLNHRLARYRILLKKTR
jgi:GH24 family phage-related lysozyme (muramidase)